MKNPITLDIKTGIIESTAKYDSKPISKINLDDGTFDFAKGNLTFNGTTLGIKGNLSGTNWSITPNDGFVYSDANKIKFGEIPIVGQDISNNITTSISSLAVMLKLIMKYPSYTYVHFQFIDRDQEHGSGDMILWGFPQVKNSMHITVICYDTNDDKVLFATLRDGQFILNGKMTKAHSYIVNFMYPI